MTGTTVTPAYRIRERQRHDGLAIEAIHHGETYPFIQAFQHENRWLIMTSPELAALCGHRFLPTITVYTQPDARTWVESLAGMYATARQVAAA